MKLRRKNARKCNCKKYETALMQICDLLDDWNNGRIIVVCNGRTEISHCYREDDILAEMRNYALAALGRDELVPGTPDQHFPVLEKVVRSNYVPMYEDEEPEEC